MRDDTTLDESTHGESPEAPVVGLRLVVVWHRDPARIGASAWLPWSGDGDTVGISRNEPRFSDRYPLDDAHVSRSAVQLVGRPDGLEVWSGGSSARFDVNGHPGAGAIFVGRDALASGFRLGIGRGALLHVRLGPPPGPRLPTLRGASEELDRVVASVATVSRAAGCVLVRGESGVGKELVAQALHALGPRASRPLVVVNMAALSPSLAASQLFGHTKGAFTGADRASPGYFGEAHGGTLFLDEVGATPPDVQALLLRTLETGEVQVLGGQTRRVDVRVVAATDENLEHAIAQGTFRAPLFHRLAVHTVRIPPLRARPVDIPVQAVAFMRDAISAAGEAWPAPVDGSPWLGRSVVEAMMDARWPGNTRELRSAVERLVLGGLHLPACGLPDLPSENFLPAKEPPAGVPDSDGSGGTPDVRAALAATDYRLGPAADRLGISRNALKRRMDVEKIRRPNDLGAAEIAAALAQGRTFAEAARLLAVSEHGLKLRAGELGVAWTD